MNRHYLGLDVLRGLGIFAVLMLHTAFYYYDGIYDLDLSNPPLIITLIGFILMFAGLFAMISGFVHTVQTYRNLNEQTTSPQAVLRYRVMAGLYILLIAYLYFLFTGPGIIQFDTRSMDQSLLVELIKSGNLIRPSLERVLYIDSLVMIGLNIILLALLTRIGFHYIKQPKRQSMYFFVLGTVVLLVSAIRIPLYTTYLNAVDSKQYGLVLLLNFFVNKNNPILPYLSFALFGAWLATLIMQADKTKTRRYVLSSGIFFVIAGLTIYLTAEETMLERQIDYTWYGIMVFQIGLFMLLILGFLRIFQSNNRANMNIIHRFLYRFGVAGLTIFFIEQLFSSSVKQIALWINPNLQLGLYTSIILGFIIALFWGFMLILWEKKHYRYGLEYFYIKWMKRFGQSEKERKLNE